MPSKTTKKLIAGIGTIVTAVLLQNGLVQAQTSPTNDQASPTNNVRKHIIQLGAPRVRTSEEMERDNIAPVNPPPRAIPFRPTIDPATYERLKDEAEAQSGSPRSKESLDPHSNHEVTP